MLLRKQKRRKWINLTSGLKKIQINKIMIPVLYIKDIVTLTLSTDKTNYSKHLNYFFFFQNFT